MAIVSKLSEEPESPDEMRQQAIIGEKPDPYDAASPREVLGEGAPSGRNEEDPPPDTPLSYTTTFDCDWQADSTLLFAEKVCQWLGGGQAHAQADAPLGGAQAQADKVDTLLCDLVTRFAGAVRAYYRDGTNLLTDGTPGARFSGTGVVGSDARAFERQRMVVKIGEEWSRLMSIVATARFMTQPDPVLRVLKELIGEAQGDLNQALLASNCGVTLAASHFEFVVLPHFGRHFELVNFSYAEDIFVMGVPVNRLHCPWDWSFIWHELAGILIQSERRLRERDRREGRSESGVVARLRDQLRELLAGDLLEAWKSDHQQLWTGYIKDGALVLSDQIVLDWAEELLEDAVAVLCLGEGMVDALRGVLQTVYAAPAARGGTTGVAVQAMRPDTRHPPAPLRVAIAESLARQMSGREGAVDFPGAQQIAALIKAEQEDVKFVARPWDNPEQAQYEEAVRRLDIAAAEKRDPAKVELPGVSSRVKVALAARAFRRGVAGGDKLRSLVYGENRWSLTWTHEEPARITDLTGLEEFGFSSVDYGTAEAADNSTYGWRWIGQHVRVRIGDVYHPALGYRLSGDALFNY